MVAHHRHHHHHQHHHHRHSRWSLSQRRSSHPSQSARKEVFMENSSQKNLSKTNNKLFTSTTNLSRITLIGQSNFYWISAASIQFKSQVSSLSSFECRNRVLPSWKWDRFTDIVYYRTVIIIYVSMMVMWYNTTRAKIYTSPLLKHKINTKYTKK